MQAEKGGPGTYQPKGDGKGKGYQGTCFKCGKVGHKAFECRSVQAVEDDGSEKTIEDVWLVGQVEVEDIEKQKGDDQEFMINHVCKDGWVRAGKKTEVTVDSAADESVCPKEWGDEMFELREVDEGKEMQLRNANGGKIKHYGKRDVTFEVEGESDLKLMGIGFQASDVRKPFAAVHRIVEKGNRVQFGPNPEDNYIQNVRTLEKVHMRKKGRSYVLDIEFVKKVGASQTFQRQP